MILEFNDSGHNGYADLSSQHKFCSQFLLSSFQFVLPCLALAGSAFTGIKRKACWHSMCLLIKMLQLPCASYKEYPPGASEWPAWPMQASGACVTC